MLNKITLIIPTHNRHSYLTRILNYYEDVGMNILIADSSKKKYKNAFKYDVEYIHYPNYSFFKKMTEIVQKINTPFVLMCADDDFIIPSAIEKCIDFLEKFSDFASVQGYYASFINMYNSIYFFNTYPSLRNYVINANTPEKRVKYHMSKYMHLFYSIHRINNLKNTFSLTPISNLNLIEIALGLISVINGKHKMLPFLYNIRESIPNSASSTIERLNTIVKNPNMKEDYETFVNSISKHLSENSIYSFKDSKEIILASLDNFINRHYPSFQGTILKPPILQRINKKMIEQLGPVFPSLSNKLFYRKRSPHYKYFSSKYRSDFNNIEMQILQHSNNRKLIIIRIKDFYNIFICFIRYVLKGF